MTVVGDVVNWNGVRYRVLMVTRNFTPYKKGSGRTTRCIGLTLGLARTE